MLTSTKNEDGALVTTVWFNRRPANYSGCWYSTKVINDGEFSLYEWSSRQGWTIEWRGLHVKYDGQPPEVLTKQQSEVLTKPQSEFLEREFEERFLGNISISALSNWMNCIFVNGQRSGRIQLQDEIKEAYTNIMGARKEL